MTVRGTNKDITITEATYTFRQSDLPRLDLHIDRGTDFGAWRTQWESYCSLAGLGREDATKQVKALTLCLSRETLAIVQNLGLTEDQMKDSAEIIEAMQRYVDGHINETVERRNFHQRTQQPGESFDDFLISLRELAKTCKFCSDSCMQKSIRDQIIEGLDYRDTIEDLLQESNLTLATTIAKCQSREAAKKHRTVIITQSTDVIVTIRKPQQPIQQANSLPCPESGGMYHSRGCSQCPALIKPAPFVISLTILPECAGASRLSTSPVHPAQIPRSQPMQFGSTLNMAIISKFTIWQKEKHSLHQLS